MRRSAELDTKLAQEMEFAESYHASHLGERDITRQILGEIFGQDPTLGAGECTRIFRFSEPGLGEAAQDMYASLRS